jgi:hypothetical protein
MLFGCAKHLSRYLFAVAEHNGETINAPVLHRQTRASFGVWVESTGARMARSINGSGCRVRRGV